MPIAVSIVSDPAISEAINAELDRQKNQIELIASENIVSEAVLKAQGSVLTNKYAEGYSGRRYYGGCEHVDTVEDLAIDRLKQLFGADFANVQPHSGAQANQAVFLALLQPGDRFLGMSLAHGGHLTHGSPVTMSGKWFNVVAYEVEQAIQAGIKDHNLCVREFHVAPEVNPQAGLPYHEWFIEFDEKPENIEQITQTIDLKMQSLNPYYLDLRVGNILKELKITPLNPNSFEDYMKSQGKLGGQNKIPRLSNDRKIVENFSESSVVLLDNPHQYTPHALNIGIEKSSGKYFVILGGHSFLDKDFINKNVEVLESNPEIGCSGGQIKNIYENEEGELIAKAMSSKFGVGNATFRTGGKAGFVDTVAFGMYRKEIHNQINGFDETLVRNQDDEYNYKVFLKGYKIYFDPEIISYYYVRGSYSKLWKQYYQYGYWKVYVNKKHKAVTSLRQLVPLFFVLGLVLGIALSFFHSIFQFLLVAGVLLYFSFSLYFGLKQSRSINTMTKVGKIFPILHFSYGLGYLSGIFNFLILNKKPSNRSKALTRK